MPARPDSILYSAYQLMIGFRINKRLFVAIFPECVGALVVIIVVLQIVTLQHLHGFAQALFVMWGNEQMLMVSH